MTGLLGRNGAGKTTLMRIITGQEFPSSGDLRVFGEDPAENDPVLRRMVFVREEQSYPDFQVRHAIRVASWFYPNWDEDLAQQLLEDFELPPQRRIKRLSRGMRSAVGIVIGLASRAELTLFDEPYAWTRSRASCSMTGCWPSSPSTRGPSCCPPTSSTRWPTCSSTW